MIRLALAFAVLSLTRAEAAAAAPEPTALATKIDAHIDAKIKAARVKPTAPATDAEFLRRATLDILGRIPTVAEARPF